MQSRLDPIGLFVQQMLHLRFGQVKKGGQFIYVGTLGMQRPDGRLQRFLLKTTS
ncbi:MAG: hypothetical protein ACOYNO_10750 [Saprospiraceae bacterium]